MKKFNYKKVDYTTLVKGLHAPVAYIENGIIKTKFATIRQNENGFYILLNGTKQVVTKSETTYKGVSTIVINGENAINKKSVKKVATKKAENEKAKKEKVSSKRAKKSNKRILNSEDKKAEDMEFMFVSLDSIKDAINNLYVLDSTTTYSIQSFLLYGYINGKGKEIKGLVERPSFKPYRSILEGINALNNATNINEVQSIFLGNVVNFYMESIAYNILKNGYEGKEIIQDMGYYERNKVSLQTSLLYKYDTKDLAHTVINDSLRLDFKMFVDPSKIVGIMFMRLKNSLRVLDKGIRNNKKVSFTSLEKMQMEMQENDENIEEKLQLITYDNSTKDVRYYQNLINDASNIVQFSSKEKNVLLHLVMGYTKKEIDAITNKRNDRTYKSIELKLHYETGMTVKEAKKLLEQEHEYAKRQAKKSKEQA